MSQLGSYLAAAAAVGAATEATGATAFTPVGQQAREGRGGSSGGGRGGPGPSFDLDLGGARGEAGGEAGGQAVEALASAFESMADAPAGGQARDTANRAQAAMRLRSRIDDLERTIDETKEDVEETVEETKKNVEESTDYDGLGVNVSTGDDGDGGGTSTLDKTERAGGQVESGVGFIAEGANTLSTAVNAARGKEYDTENTYRERFGLDDDPGATRQIDYPDAPSLPSREEFQKDVRESATEGMKDAVDPLGVGRKTAEKGEELLGGIL